MIVHLVVIITLLSCRITRLTVKENTFVLDFSNQEEAEELRRIEEFKADISAMYMTRQGSFKGNWMLQEMPHSKSSLKKMQWI